jgi:mannose/fructose/N-acetylgalactosamine-specific phosphotransferase system component IID
MMYNSRMTYCKQVEKMILSLFLSNVFDGNTQLHALVIQEKLDQVVSDICVIVITMLCYHLIRNVKR